MHLESFRAVRWIRTINLVLQAILVLTLFAGLNIVAVHYSWRHDLTRNHRHTLSPETKSYLENLKRPVRVVVTLGDNYQDPDVVADVKGILREYAFASASSGHPISVEYLDPFLRQAEAEALGIRETNTIFFLCGDRRRGVRPEELYRLEAGDKREFLAEQVFTAALLDVSSLERSKLYFLTGHGELQPDEVSATRGLSVLRDELRIRNFSIETIDLTHAKRVPDDAALVVIAGPDRIEPFAEEQLRQYMRDRAGRVLLLLTPRVNHGLTDLLLDWGVLLGHNDIIVDNNPENITPEGNLRIPGFYEHPITQTLTSHKLPVLVGYARSVAPVPGRNARTGITTTILAAASETAWGETSNSLSEAGPGPGDIRGNKRLAIAMACERVQVRDNLRFSVRGGRLVVIGCSDLAVNGRISGSPGNLALLLNAVNWTVDRDAQLAILPRPIDKFQLSLSQQQLSRLNLALLFGVPGLAALLGIAVYWTRRS